MAKYGENDPYGDARGPYDPDEAERIAYEIRRALEPLFQNLFEWCEELRQEIRDAAPEDR